MDNVTHALAGLLLADLTVAAYERHTKQPASASFARAAAVVGVIAAELPDSDLVYSGPLLGMGKLGYLLHHRGHTHTVVVAVCMVLLLWAAVEWWRRRRGTRAELPTARKAESLALLGLALVGGLSHLLLDFTNSYGVHPFWPVDNRWFYGDAIFILEPWLWIAAIPALLYGRRSRTGRVLLGLALLAVVAAGWGVSLVERPTAIAFTVVAVALLVVMRAAPRGVRLGTALAGWVLVEATGFAATARAEAHLMSTVPTVVDAVLTPRVGDPRCVTAIVVELDGETYRVSTATVSAWPSLRDALSCAGGDGALRRERRPTPGIGGGLRPSTRAATARVAWKQEWVAPRAALVSLAAARCDVTAALEFMRVPVWESRADGTVILSDFRFGFGGGGFADVVFPADPEPCPGVVPGWRKPRGDVLGERG